MDHVPYAHGGKLRDLTGRGRTALDIGGGTGRIARRLGDAYARVVLVDVERAMLARGRARGFACVQADAARLPFRDGAVELCLMVDALHHFPRQEEALAEAARVLAPGGRLVVEEFDPASLSGRLVMWGERLARFGSRFHAPAQLRDAVAATGLATRAARHSRRDHVVVGEKTA